MVSAGTITAIALDRYITIVRSPRSRNLHANACASVATSILVIWLLSFLVTSPLFFYTQVETVKFEGITLSEECIELWPSPAWRCLFTALLTLIQFIIPVFVLTTIHLKISAYLKLHLRPITRSKPKIEVHSPAEDDNDMELTHGPKDGNKELLNIDKRKESVCSENSQRSCDSSRKNSDCSESKRSGETTPRKRSELLTSFRENSEFSGFSFSKLGSERSKAKTHKRARRELRRNRRTMMILSCIAVVYAASWLPMNLFQVLSNLDVHPDDPDTFFVLFACCHILAMSTAVTNPLLYGWLNTNFRREFSLIFSSFSKVFKRQFNNKTSTILNNNNDEGTRLESKVLMQFPQRPLERRLSLTLVTAKLNATAVTILNGSSAALQL